MAVAVLFESRNIVGCFPKLAGICRFCDNHEISCRRGVDLPKPILLFTTQIARGMQAIEGTLQSQKVECEASSQHQRRHGKETVTMRTPQACMLACRTARFKATPRTPKSDRNGQLLACCRVLPTAARTRDMGIGNPHNCLHVDSVQPHATQACDRRKC